MLRTCLILALALAVVPSFASAQQTTDAKAKQIEAIERAINAAIQKGDVKAFQANIAEDAIAVDGNGRMPIGEFIKSFNQIKLTKFAIDQANVQFLNDTTAVLTYRFTGEGSFMGQPMPSPTWSSSVYVLRGGKWQAVFHQESVAAPAPPGKK